MKTKIALIILTAALLAAPGCVSKSPDPAPDNNAANAGSDQKIDDAPEPEHIPVNRKPEGYCYHWAEKTAWEKQKPSGFYLLPGYKFVPTTKTQERLIQNANRLLEGSKDELVVLVIDETKVKAPLEITRHKSLPEDYLGDPMINGPLNLDAVIRVIPFKRNPRGSYTLPPDTP